MVCFRVLGPVEVYRGERGVELAGPRQVALLAFLLVHANRAVSTDVLGDALWGEQDPAGAVKRVQVAIGRLRRVLQGDRRTGGEPVLRTVAGGYLLAVEPGAMDAEAFRAGVQEGRAALAGGEPARAGELLRRALGLWRGPALADVTYESWAQAEIAALEELRLAALELRVEADLTLGRHSEVIGELESLVRAHPTRERLVSQQMLALYRAGRQADALAAYREAGRRLLDELGLEPSPTLRELERAILAHDPNLDAAPAVPPSGQPTALVAPAGGSAALGSGEAEHSARSVERPPLPTGVVTFVLSDIEGSSGLWERDREAMARALELHDELIAGAVAAGGGYLLKAKGEGDATLSVFRRASDGVAAAAALQTELGAAAWPAGLALRVRVAVHTGEAHERSGDYFGPALNRAARLRALARGGATVLSQATAEIVRDRLPDHLELVDVGERQLRGLSRPERVFELRSRARRPAPGPAATPARIQLALPRPLAGGAEFPFVARERELDRLRQLWTNRGPGVPAAMVAGEAGIGKTRLASELARSLLREGALVLYGRCDEGLALPYQPFVEALRPAAHALGSDQLMAELGRLAPELGRLWPELDALEQPLSSDPETERYTLFQAVSALLVTASRAQRVLLVLDDLHWAAQPTLLLLRHLVRSERPLRGLVLGSYRETELDDDHPLPGLLADLQRDPGTTTVRIGGLDERAIAALLQAAAGHALDERAAEYARRLRAETGGNPFFIRELLAHLVESGTFYRAGERWTTDLAAAELDVPEGLRQVIRQRVARLSEPARGALAVAAVAGPRFSLALLEAVLGERPGLLDALDESVAAGLLTEAGPGEYAFAHALVRQTLYDEQSAARRMRRHRELAETLEQQPGPDAHVEALAHHFAHAAADGQATKAAAYALAAGRHATARLAYEDAAAHYERGLAALELAQPPDPERRCELLLALGEARWNLGDGTGAQQACQVAAELAERLDDAARLARAALTFCGPSRITYTRAVGQSGVDLLERALGALGEAETPLRARTMARLALSLSYIPAHRERRRALADEALAMARRIGEPAALAEALAANHEAAWGPDNAAERLALSRELAGRAAELGDGALAATAHARSAGTLLELADVDASGRELQRLERLAEALQQSYPRWFVAVARATRAYLEGRLEDCEALAHAAAIVGRGWNEDTAMGMLAIQLLHVRSEQRRFEEALEYAERIAERLSDLPTARIGLALTYAQCGRHADARQEVERLSHGDFSEIPRDAVWLASICGLCEVAALLDDAQHARPLYALLLPYADRCALITSVDCLGSTARPLGLVATTLSRFDDAARHFETALAINSRIQSPLLIAHTQHGYARALLRRRGPGDRHHALELLDAALAAADKLALNAVADTANGLKRQADAVASA